MMKIFWTFCLAIITILSVNGGEGKVYSYFYQNKLVEMPSLGHVFAVERDDVQGTMKLYQFNDSFALEKHNLQLVVSDKKMLQQTQINCRPVFDQGQFLMVPSSEIIIAFKNDISLDQGREIVEACLENETIKEFRSGRGNLFLFKVLGCETGRVFELSRLLSVLDSVRYAEPNLIVARKKEGLKRTLKRRTGIKQTLKPKRKRKKNKAPAWSVLANLDFESSDYLDEGWSIANGEGKAATYWGQTDYIKYEGEYSLYCAKDGRSGVAPPGPVVSNMEAILRSPEYDLSQFAEVYFELRFYAKNGGKVLSAGVDFTDFASVYISDGEVTEELRFLGVSYQLDCTEDPTTDDGWRKTLCRISPEWRVNGVTFSVIFKSGNDPVVEGAYIDDLKIIASENVDSWSISNDTYSARQYEYHNVGQIAGIGQQKDSMQVVEAWNLTEVDDEVIVAVCDSGVDLTHPDLNIVGGFNADGSVGGSDTAPHGTAVAGNVGAIGNNGRGVIGVAPGVKILSVNIGSSVSEAASAIDVAIENFADIINCSWGYNGASFQAITDAVSDALSEDIVVLFAAGNGPDREPWNYNVIFPANLTGSMNVIAVGGTDLTKGYKGAASDDGWFTSGSSYIGSGPDICAPYSWSYTTDVQGVDGYNDGSLIDPDDPESADYLPNFGGTSSSCPKVAGVVALMLSQDSSLTPGQVKRILRDSADDIGEPGIDEKTGAGQVNAAKAVMQVLKDSANKSMSINNLAIQLHNNKIGKDKVMLKGQLPANTSIHIGALSVFIDGFGISCDETIGQWKESTRKGNTKYTYMTNNKYEGGKFTFKYNQDKYEWQITLIGADLDDVIDYTDGVTVIIKSSTSRYRGNVSVDSHKKWQFSGKKDGISNVYNLAKTVMPGYGFEKALVNGNYNSKKDYKDQFTVSKAEFGLDSSGFAARTAVLTIGNFEYELTGFSQKGTKQIYSTVMDNLNEQITVTLNFENNTWDAKISKTDLAKLAFDSNGLIISLEVGDYIGAKKLDINQTTTLSFKR